MALVENSYAPPGVYTNTVYNANTPQLNASARVAVLIGEGQQTFTHENVELHRGSSAIADDLVAGENLSDQVDGLTRTFQLTYFPVVAGDGSGTVTSDPSKITVTANDTAVAVVSLNGKLGRFSTQSIIPVGANVVVSYFFKKTDTKVVNEDQTTQVPTFATLSLQGGLLGLSLSTPGVLGNQVSLALTVAASGSGVSDAQAVTGAGSDTISIELRKTDNTVRNLNTLAQIIAGITTQDGGYIVPTNPLNPDGTLVTGGTTLAAALAAVNFTGGAGQSTNSVFKTNFVPIVDGSNGGVVTTDPAKVIVLVNSLPVAVSAVAGATGLVTLANGVPPGASVQITYFTNNYQDTADFLPSANGEPVVSIDSVGYGPGAANFIQGVDYVQSGNRISWGATASAAIGVATPGFTPFDASVITTTLVDEKVYLRPVTGAVSGRNSVFILGDVPVDGSGLGRATDNPELVAVYVGTDPVDAASRPAVRIAALSGASATVTLYNPPTVGQNVYASYYRSALNDHAFTLTAKAPGIPGQGSYTITDELGAVAPVATVVTVPSDAQGLGLVWPNNFSDLTAALDGADETITLTFQNETSSEVTQQPIQASLVVPDTNNIPRIQFLASTPGVAGNSVTITLVGGPTGAADAAAVSVTGSTITVETVKADNTTVRTWQEIVALFSNPAHPVNISGAGTIVCQGIIDTDLTPQASSFATTHLAGGAAAVTANVAYRFRVTTSRTTVDAKDGKGLTGGATTPSGSNVGSSAVGAVGYLGQTYIDAATGVKFTLVDPARALNFGYTQLPSPGYGFVPGDTITFNVNSEAGHVVGALPTIAIPGLRTKVVSTLGMNPGDTAVISTFNRAGNSPAVGEYYYVTYETGKTAADMALKTFDDVNAAFAQYGAPTLTNRLSLAARIFNQNAGDQTFACIQVPVAAGAITASDQAYIAAIQSLTRALPGSTRHANVVVVLSTSPTVHQFLATFLAKQAAPRQMAEATTVIGFDQYATVDQIATRAAALMNQRVVAIDKPAFGVSLTDPVTGTSVEYPVDGTFAAAGLAGLMLAPGNDVATSLTNQPVVGITRSLVDYDGPTMNQLAVAGVTCLVNTGGALSVRHHKTTNPSNILTSEPYVTTTADFINQSFRTLLKQFVGRKGVSDLNTTIQGVLNGQLQKWCSNNDAALISAYGQLSVVDDPTDPTVVNIAVPVKPIFAKLYFMVTLSVNLAM